jgi:hypothetical protein
MPGPAGLATVRQLCLALPEVTERISHGEPCWFVRDKKLFAMFADRHHDDRLACWLAAPPGELQALVADDPALFFVPPYVGGRGWVGVRLDRPGLAPAVLAQLVTEAYRVVAPGAAGRAAPRFEQPGPHSLVEYYSDATYTVRVGEFEDGPCGYVDWGQQTQYAKHYWRTC